MGEQAVDGECEVVREKESKICKKMRVGKKASAWSESQNVRKRESGEKMGKQEGDTTPCCQKLRRPKEASAKCKRTKRIRTRKVAPRAPTFFPTRIFLQILLSFSLTTSHSPSTALFACTFTEPQCSAPSLLYTSYSSTMGCTGSRHDDKPSKQQTRPPPAKSTNVFSSIKDKYQTLEGTQIPHA